MRILRIYSFAFFLAVAAAASAQVGEYRNDLSIGVNAGYALSSVSFQPKVSQVMHGGITGGVTLKYVCEKYFNTLCAVLAEINYACIGWKEDILDIQNQPVINAVTKQPEEYKRTMNYIQVPVFAHLAWGKERGGLQFFFQAGPQLGFFLNEKTTSNYEAASRNIADRANSVFEQEQLSVEKKFDYGIAVGAGLEYSLPKIGHILFEGRYYYGLGNVFGSTKRDYFGRSNHNTIYVKMAYLFDIIHTKGN
ncbi:MAG: porin family protein [Prevotella sp.]|uniref:porin family protein n=1 Tax=Prevotella sp. TaxID=59823 RepID=UPI002A2CC765|nr:porin family protein [Prevotella sp.]MDD7318058.1 porin family protein [Prevotellaceae bacterium]MDY4021053.1 porin family protein [Prevotella sp.]